MNFFLFTGLFTKKWSRVDNLPFTFDGMASGDAKGPQTMPLASKLPSTDVRKISHTGYAL